VTPHRHATTRSSSQIFTVTRQMAPRHSRHRRYSLAAIIINQSYRLNTSVQCYWYQCRPHYVYQSPTNTRLARLQLKMELSYWCYTVTSTTAGATRCSPAQHLNVSYIMNYHMNQPTSQCTKQSWLRKTINKANQKCRSGWLIMSTSL